MEVWLVAEPGFRLGAAHFSTSTFSTLHLTPPLSAGPVLSHLGREWPILVSWDLGGAGHVWGLACFLCLISIYGGSNSPPRVCPLNQAGPS